MKKQEGYKCDFCSKMSISKSGMMKHEAACSHNPENISMCKDCQWLDKFEGRYYDSNGYPSKYTEFTCKATNKKLYHNKVLRYNKELRNSIISRCDGKMPSINEGCPYFQEYDYTHEMSVKDFLKDVLG